MGGAGALMRPFRRVGRSGRALVHSQSALAGGHAAALRSGRLSAPVTAW
jgi:hypothetical protein